MPNNNNMGFVPNIVPNLRSAARASINKKPTAMTTESTLKASLGEQPSPNKVLRANPKSRSRNRGKNTKFGDDSSSGSSSASSSEGSFAKPVERTSFYDDGSSSKIEFNESVPVIVSQMQLDKGYNNESKKDNKYRINLGTYSRPDTASPDVTDPVTAQYQLIFNRLSRDVVKTIKGKAIDDWTFINFYNAIDASIRALECYYTTDSILSYKSSDSLRDNNWAIIDHQKRLDSSYDILPLQNELRKSLKGVWFPEEFSKLIRWTFQTYKAGTNDQCVNYRFVPTSKYLYSGVNNPGTTLPTHYDSILGDLSNMTYIKIYSILSQVYPQGEIFGLPKSCNMAYHDSKHYEVLINQPNMYEIGTVQGVFPLSDDDEFVDNGIPYVSYSNPENMSGLPFLLQTQFSSESDIPDYGFFRTFLGYDGTVNPIDRSNKYVYNVANNQHVPATWYGNSYPTYQTEDVHKIWYNPLDTSIKYQISQPIGGQQKLYFDVKNAPLISMRDFVDSVFYL